MMKILCYVFIQVSVSTAAKQPSSVGFIQLY